MSCNQFFLIWLQICIYICIKIYSLIQKKVDKKLVNPTSVQCFGMKSLQKCLMCNVDTLIDDSEEGEGVGIKKLSCYHYKCITTLKLGQYSFFKNFYTYKELSVVAAKCQLAGLALRSNMFPSVKPRTWVCRKEFK